MRRLLIIIAAGAISLASIGVAAFYALFHTPPGRAFIVSLIEPALGDALGGETEIGALEGAPPNHVILKNISVSGQDGVWLKIDDLVLDWNALSLIRSRINIARLDISGVHLLGAPPKAEKREKTEPSLPSLPEGLPNLVIRDFSITKVEVAEGVFGRPLRLDGAGSLAMNDRAISATVEANGAGDTDLVSAKIDLDPAAKHGLIDLTIASQADGFVSGLIGADGRIYVEAHGEAPLDDFSVKVDSDIGAYGSAGLTVSGDLQRARSLHVDAKLALGDKLGDVRNELGDTVDLAALVEMKDDAMHIGLDHLDSAAGRLTGDLQWLADDEALQSASAMLHAAFAASYQPDLQAIIGGEATLNVKLQRLKDAYKLAAALAAPNAQLSLDDARTDLDAMLNGLVTLKLQPRDDLPVPLKAGATATGALTLAKGDIPKLEELRIETPDGSAFQGAMRYDFTREAIAIGGDATITPGMIALLAPDMRIKQPVKATLSASGDLATVSGQIEIDTPSLEMKDGALPPALASINFARQEPALTLDLKAHAKEKPGDLEAKIVIDGEDKISAPKVSLAGERFTLQGSGVYHEKAQAADIKLAYEGQEGAKPWPGTALAGSLSVEGKVGRSGDKNDLAVDAKNLVVGDIAIGALKATARGPSGALAVNASAQSLRLPGLESVDRLDLAGTADLGKAATLRLAKLDFRSDETQAHLTAPARLTFKDGVAIDNFRASLSPEGSIAIDGAFAPTRWRAAIAVKETPIPGADALITASLDLDTDKKAIAQGEFTARSALIDLKDSAISGALAWDGTKLRITDADPKDAVDLDLSLPLVLTRSPNLSAAFDGDMKGRIDFAGRLEEIAPYLPTSLQSLEGDARLEASIAGTVDKPQVTGKLTVDKGAYTELASGLSLEGIKGEANASATNESTVLDFDFGAHGHGQTKQTISLSGKAAFGDESRLDASIKADGARFAAGPVKSSTTSGELTLKGPFDSVQASGALTVGALDAEIVTPKTDGLVGIEVVPINDGEEPAPKAESSPAPPLALDITITAKDQLFIRGRGLDSEWSADIHASGDADDPLLIGSVNLRRGFLEFSGRRFDLTQGVITFDKLSKNNPALDIRAEYKTSEGVTAAIVITGRAEAPSVSLVSTPSMPTNDIMALILFGKQATELSALESLQVAQAVAQLGGIGPFGSGGGITSAARRALGLDLLTVDIDADAGASTLEIGKYLASGLFVSATQDVRGENGAVRVEYEITDSISVETKLQQNGDQTISANWKHDF